MIRSISNRCSIGDAVERFSRVEAIHDRGVAVVEGCFFIGGSGRGTPPAGALTPRVVMQAQVAPLTAAEKETLTRAVRQRVEAVVAAELEAVDGPIDLVEAHYRLDQPSGLHVVAELHGLDLRRIQRRYG